MISRVRLAALSRARLSDLKALRHRVFKAEGFLITAVECPPLLTHLGIDDSTIRAE